MSEHLKGLPACTSCNSAEWQRWLLPVARAVGVPAKREGNGLVWGVGNTWETPTRLFTYRTMKVIEKRRPSRLTAAGAERADASEHKPPVWPAGESLWKLITGSHRRQQSLFIISQAMRWLSHLTHAEAVGTDYSVPVCLWTHKEGQSRKETEGVLWLFLPIPAHRRLHPVSIHTSTQARGTRASGLYLVLAESGLHQPCGFVELPLLGVGQREMG